MFHFRNKDLVEKQVYKDVERKLICHVPDLCVFEKSVELPHTITYDGVLLFADISGFTALTEKYTVSSERGADALTVTLNEYIGKIVKHILTMGGDVLKFAGDAILAVWRVSSRSCLAEACGQAIKAAMIIQQKCDGHETDVGVKLRVKMAISCGKLNTTFLGNDESVQFVMTGRPVGEVNAAEKFCEPGLVVLAPNAMEFAVNEFALVDVLPGRFGIVKYLCKQPRINWESYIFLPDDLDYAEDDKNKYERVSMQIEPNIKREMYLRKFISNVVKQKLDDDQPLKYLSEMRQCSIVFINLSFDQNEIARNFVDVQRETLQIALCVVQDECRKLQGAINKIFMFDKGCTLLCIFGLPGDKHEREPAHALCAAYNIKNVSQTSF